MSLKSKAISGILWTFAQQFSVKAINLIVQIVLARLLLPEVFGIVALLQIFISLGQVIMDGGMTSSLIRDKEADQRDYSTVFFMNLIFSVLLYGLIFILAPFISDFFEQPIITSVLRVYTLTYVIQALIGVQTTRLTKEMNFKLQMTMQIPSTIVGAIAGVVLALNGFGVWAIVWMNLITTTCYMLQIWIKTGWRPSFLIDRAKLKAHFNFGYKLTLSSIVTSLYSNSYTFVIGKYFSTTQLGYYNQANSLRMFPVHNLVVALQKVTYPLFASIQENTEHLKSVFARITKIVFFLVTPIMFFLAGVAEPLFRLVLTEKWLPAVPFFQILCICTVFNPQSMYNLNIIVAKGRSDLHLKLELIKKGISSLFLLLIVPFGIWGVVYAQAMGLIVHFYINALYCGRMINYPIREQLLDILPFLIIGGTSLLAMIFADTLFTHFISQYDFLRLFVSGVVYFGSFIGISFSMKLNALEELKSIILNLKNSRTKNNV